jgi:chaperonin GroEL
MATPDLGYNALTGEFENLVESGIIDPVKVVIESLKNASAVSCSILTMGATVAEKSTERIANV